MRGGLHLRPVARTCIPHGLPFWQLYDIQILEIQIRGWVMRLQTERACGQSRFLAGVRAFRAGVGVIAHLNAIHINGNVTTA